MTTTDPYPGAAPGYPFTPPYASDAPNPPYPEQPPAPPQQGHAPAQPAGPPVFGRRTTETKRIPFSLATYDQRGTEVLHSLTALAIADMGSVFGFGRSGTNTRAQLGAIRNLLMRTLVDDDGIGLHEQPQQVVFEADDSSRYIPLDDLDDDARREALSEAVWRTPQALYGSSQEQVAEEFHDDEDAAAEHMREHGSSLRRFTAIMDDDSLIVMNEALEQIVDYIMTEAADRPTKRSSPSSRSRPPKGR